MPSSGVTTVEQYLDQLPPERREVVSKVRDTIRRNLPKGYEETINSGMIGYEIPLSKYPNTYNRKPLSLAAIAAQKSHYAVYLMCAYQDPKQAKWLEQEFAKSGKKLDMGKSCVRFKKLDDVDLNAIGKVIADTPPEKFIKQYEAGRKRS